jgi:transcriptional/translational regulatory protein YebC/TACO1
MESRMAGGDVNSAGLAAVIERAKKDSMPKENIDRAVAKGKDSEGADLQAILFEAFGPGGVAMLITAVTDNNKRTAPEIKNIFTKSGYALGSPGSSAWAFTKSEDGYTPLSPTDISEEDGEKLASLIEKLEEHEDVQDVYTSTDEV